MFARALLLGAASVALTATAAPADDVDVSLKSPLCGLLPGPALALNVNPVPSADGFTATATATLCNATAIVTAIQMQFAGAGVNGSPAGGGPIAGAPFEVSFSNSASVTGSSAVPSGLTQTVVLDVTAQSVTRGTQHVTACQAVVQFSAGRLVRFMGC